jgi:hypothetical protein
MFCDGRNRLFKVDGVENGSRTICQSDRLLLIQVYGYMLPNGLYSYTQPITIRIVNTYDPMAIIDSIELSSTALNSIVNTFVTVQDYSTTNITINASLLRPNSSYNLFAKDQ